MRSGLGSPFRFFIIKMLSGAVFATVVFQSLALTELSANSEFSMPAQLAEKSLLLDITAVGDRFVVVGERGHILLFDNKAGHWQQIKVPTRATLTAVTFHDEKLGLAVGHDAVILRSEDGGQTWKKVHDAPEEERPLLDVRFKTDGRAVAVGAYGYVLESSDGGRTWDPQVLRTTDVKASEKEAGVAPQDEQAIDDFHLNQVRISETGEYYLAAEAGTIYRSDDEGATWIHLPSPYEGSFFGVLPLRGKAVLVFGLEGHLYRSSDAGNHWIRINTDTRAALMDGKRLQDGTVILVGFSGVVLVSTDDGNHFTLQQQSNRSGIAAVTEAKNGDLILVGEGGIRRVPRAHFHLGPPS